jgi:hypothetical protein
MKDVIIVIAIFVVWILLQKVILPKLGIQT